MSGAYTDAVLEAMCLWASSMLPYIPAAEAANIAAPRAQVWSLSATRISFPRTSASVCITYGDFFAMPPVAMIFCISIPSFSIRSFIALAPNAVASTRDLNTCGADVPRLMPVNAPFAFGSRSGVRRPFIQSMDTGSSGAGLIMDASSVSRSSRFFSTDIAALSLSPMSLSGQPSSRLNHAYRSPNAAWPAS